ncbi:MAG: YopX family protein [Filifactoraceae bacterium]
MFNFKVIDRLSNKVVENAITYNGYVYKNFYNFQDGEPYNDEDIEVLLGTGIMLDGKELFRGDILKDEENYLWEVVYRNGSFMLENLYFPGAILIDSIEIMSFEFVGNKFENPKILEG